MADTTQGAAVRTMAEAGQDSGILGLAERVDRLVLPWDESPWPRLQAAVANRGQGRPAERTSGWAAALREYFDELREERDAARRREEENRRKAFIEAARTGDLPFIRKLLEAGVDIDTRGGNRQTALHEAVLGNRPEIVEALINAGADLELCNDDGWTALELAERHGNWDAERLLEDAGASRTETPYDDPSPW